MSIKIDRPGSATGFVTPAGQEVLTNKDIDGSTASNTSRITMPKDTKANLDALTRKEGTVVYATDLDKLFFDNGTILTEVGSGSGSGKTNWVLNPNSESSATADLTIVNATVTRDTTTPIAGDSSFKIQPTTAASIEVEWDTSIPDYFDDTQVIAEGLFNLVDNTSGSTYRFGIWNTTDNVWVEYQDFSVVGKYQFAVLGSIGDVSVKTFVPRLADVSGTPGTSDDIRCDGVRLGPNEAVIGQSVPQIDWTAYTPTFTGFGSVTNKDIQYMRKGSSLWIRGDFTAGVTTAVEHQITLPSGTTIGGPGATAPQLVGLMKQDASEADKFFGVLSTVGDAFLNVSRVSGTGNPLAPLTTADLTNSVRYAITAGPIPIAEWADEETRFGTNSDVEYAFNSGSDTAAGATNSTDFAKGSGGTAINNIASTTGNSVTSFDVEFDSDILPTDTVVLQVKLSVESAWVNAENASESLASFRRDSDKLYGMGLTSITGQSKRVRVQFGNYGRLASNASYAGLGATWSGATSVLWRVVKSANPLGIGVPLATAERSGAIAAGERTLLSGLVISPSTANGSTTVVGTAGVYVHVTGCTIVLPEAGTYLLSFGCRFAFGHATAPTRVVGVASPRKNDGTTILQTQDVAVASYNTTNFVGSTNGQVIYVASSTANDLTLKLYATISESGGSSPVRNVTNGYITAIRIS